MELRDAVGARNTSDAVMAQRGLTSVAADDFPTPPWATRALFRHVVGTKLWENYTAWEPCANRGYMAEPLKDYFARVFCSDLYDFGYCGAGFDFLQYQPALPIDVVCANPPFKLAAQFALRGLEVATWTFLLVRLAFLEGQGRFENLFRDHPPHTIAQFAERVPMVQGVWDPDASSATAYCWCIWDKTQEAAQRFVWIPPCRGELERPVERFNALLKASKHYNNKAEAIGCGFDEGNAEEYVKRASERAASASRALRALHADVTGWPSIRPDLRDVDGTVMTDAKINRLLAA